MYSLLPVLFFLATANAAAIDRSGAQEAALEKRLLGLPTVCLFGTVGVFGECAPAPSSSSSSSSAKATTTSASSSSSSSAKASTSTSSSSSSSSSASASTTAKASTTSTSTGNVVQTAVSVSASVIDCPLGVIFQGVCSNTATASASASASASSSSAKASASASSSSAAGNVISSVVAPVASAASSVVAPVVSAASSVVAPVVSAASSVVAPVASSASSVVAPVVSAASSVVAPVASSASSVVAPVVSAASSVVAPVASSASSVVAPVVSAASSVVAPVVSAASSVVAPVASSVSSVLAPASSSVSSIIASVSASSAAASSSAVSSSSVVPTTTSTSTTPSASATPVNPSVSGWAYQAVIAEGTSGRALTGSTFAGSSMTVESCLAFCDNGGYPLAGLEYSSECYCGSTLSNGASLSKTATGGMACSGNPNELCGGSSALSLYRSTKSNGAGLNSDLTSKTVALPAGWSSTTCMQEVSGRAFTKKSTASDSMTIGQCLSFCGDSKYAGLEYGRECYCADTLSNGASLTSTSGQCVTACSGDASTTCGGPNALQVYTNSNFKGSSSGAYTNTGCVQEVDGRLLRGASIAADNMTIETCTNFCQSQSMSIAGLEYGRECYCGNSYVSSPLQSGQCNMACAGNSNQNCGGPNALNIFTLGA